MLNLLNKLSNLTGVQSDKVLHFLVCFVVTFALSWVHVIIAIIFALILSFYKEFMDMNEKGNYWSWGDILADSLGILTAVILWLVLTYL